MEGYSLIEVVSVKFKNRGKTYFFDPRGLEISPGDQIVVETSKGLELCDCVQGPHTVLDERIVPPLRPVVRIATDDDRRILELCKAREKEALVIAEKKIAEHGLEMKLVDVECAFDGSKLLFFFTADGRVDFRALVRDLAGVFRTRIELRQIGVRDEAKMLGGIGMCGRPYCCNLFLDDFAPVSTKMAKVQSLSLNPTKISGCCGRLMCCLRYEEEAYEELVRTVPRTGAFVETVAGYGNVTAVNLLRQTVKVRLDNDEDQRTYPVDEIAVIPGGRPREGTPPHILKLVPKPEPEPEPDTWTAPAMFAEDTAATVIPESTQPRRSGKTHARGKGGGGGKKPVHVEKAEAQQRSESKPVQPHRSRDKKPQIQKAVPRPEAAPAPAGEKKSGGRRRYYKPRGKQSGEG